MLRTVEKRGPSGKMEICFEHQEPGSEHYSLYETSTLEGDGTQLILRTTSRETSIHSSGGAETNDAYAIAPEVLIDFIKKNGRKI